MYHCNKMIFKEQIRVSDANYKFVTSIASSKNAKGYVTGPLNKVNIGTSDFLAHRHCVNHMRDLFAAFARVCKDTSLTPRCSSAHLTASNSTTQEYTTLTASVLLFLVLVDISKIIRTISTLWWLGLKHHSRFNRRGSAFSTNKRRRSTFIAALFTAPLRKIFPTMLGTFGAQRNCIKHMQKLVADKALVSSDTTTTPCCTTVHLVTSNSTPQKKQATKAWTRDPEMVLKI